MIKQEEDGVWSEMTEVIACHHEDAFACLTTEGGLTRWLSVSAEVDLRDGGLIVLGWDAKAKRRTTIAILSHDPGGSMVWDWEVGADSTHAPLYWQVEPSTEEGVRVTLRQGPFSADPESLMEMARELVTWRWYLCNLRTTLEAHHDMRKVRPL